MEASGDDDSVAMEIEEAESATTTVR